MPLTLINLVGLLLFLIGLIFMFLVVPYPRIRELFWIGMLGGFGISLLLIYTMQNVLGFWIFRNIDLVSVAGVPLFISLSWFPFIIAFSHLLAQYENVMLVSLLLLAFPLGFVLLHALFLNSLALIYINWNLYLTFFLALIIHLFLALYLFATGRLDNFKNVETP